MYKDFKGKWVNGSAAKAKYHVQVRSSSKMMEMTSHYLDKFCGDGTTPRNTVMTARAKVDKRTGQKEDPKKTIVKKYSFTYAMAFERMSQGKGLVSRDDRAMLTKIDELIGLVRKTLPMASDNATAEIIKDWLNILDDAYGYIENGQKPFYLTDILGCWPEQLQFAMELIYEKEPDQEWRIKFGRIVDALLGYGIVEKDRIFPIKEYKEKDDSRDYWAKKVRTKMDSRYNIRTDIRFPADLFSSDTIRGWLEWIIFVPSASNYEEYKSIMHDIESVKDFIKDARRYPPRTKQTKEEVGIKLKLMLNDVKTNIEEFITGKKVDREKICQMIEEGDLPIYLEEY